MQNINENNENQNLNEAKPNKKKSNIETIISSIVFLGITAASITGIVVLFKILSTLIKKLLL